MGTQEPLLDPPRAQSSLGEVGGSLEKGRSRAGKAVDLLGKGWGVVWGLL